MRYVSLKRNSLLFQRNKVLQVKLCQITVGLLAELEPEAKICVIENGLPDAVVY